MDLSLYLKESPKKRIIFDFDETLFTLHLPWNVFSEKVRQKLSEVNSDLVAEYTKNGKTNDLMNKAIKLHGQRARDIIMSWGVQFERDYIEKISINSKLIEFIENEVNNFEFYIWSSNMFSTISRVLKKYKLNNHFQKVIARDAVDLSKPYPDGFFKIFNPNIHKRSDFLFVGDSEFDKQAADSAGIDYFKIKMITE